MSDSTFIPPQGDAQRGVELSSTEEGYALFDLDHTLLPFDTQVLFCNFVLRRHPLRRFHIYFFLLASPLAAFKILRAKGMKRVFHSYLWGMKKEKVESLAKEFAEQVLPTVAYPQVVELLRSQKNKGRMTILNTASPDFYAKEIARVLGFDRYYGTKLQLKERMPLFPVIEGDNNKGRAKLHSMAELYSHDLHEHPNQKLPNSHAFSDSRADIPLLHTAEHATMVNPSSSFFREGERRAWKVIRPPTPYQSKWGNAACAIRQALGLYRVKNVS